MIAFPFQPRSLKRDPVLARASFQKVCLHTIWNLSLLRTLRRDLEGLSLLHLPGHSCLLGSGIHDSSSHCLHRTLGLARFLRHFHCIKTVSIIRHAAPSGRRAYAASVITSRFLFGGLFPFYSSLCSSSSFAFSQITSETNLYDYFGCFIPQPKQVGGFWPHSRTAQVVGAHSGQISSLFRGHQPARPVQRNLALFAVT
jgi:hypothetical protein